MINFLLNKKWIILTSIFLLLGIGLSFSNKQVVETVDLPDKVDFNNHIRPILSQNCFTCHGPDSSSRKANLRLDNLEGATAILKNGGAAIVPGKPSKSLLIKRISDTNPELQMPPPEVKKILSDYEIALLTKWIKQGAEWKPHWAFIPPQEPELPSLLRTAAPSEIIDYLVDKAIKSRQLAPSPKANKQTLIRRVAYLLTGLPPKPTELQSFLADSTDRAYEQMINQYLASPQYGERWARHWMDLVRYGEYMGHEFDFPISGAWQYRDYLIRAFNQDVPYDLLVKEHLSGDMLAAPRYHPEEGFNESILGTGYFYLGEGKHSPVSLKKEEADRIDNVIDVTSKTFQALTVSCARCHDHKFDPIPATDYYAMYGMVESARLGPVPARITPEKEQQIRKLKEIKDKIRAQIGKQLSQAIEQPTPKFISEQKQFIQNLGEPSADTKVAQNYDMIGDFRQGTWEGWHVNGFAFGETPLMGEPVFSKKSHRLKNLEGGFASSRAFSSGLQGSLRSSNFIIEADSIAISARGNKSSIRIIVDNFQLIQYPLYGSLEKVIDTEKWKTFVFDVSMVKGHKAYIEFLPGHYDRYQYRILPENYVEVQYALAFDKEFPDRQLLPPAQSNDFSLSEKKQVVEDWAKNQTDVKQIHFLNKLIKKISKKKYTSTIVPLMQEYHSIAAELYDPTHFIGLTEGDAIFSPVFIRGDFNQLSTEKVQRQFLHAIEVESDSFPQQGSGRLAWAEAVTNPNNPLTARVMVNRLWHHLFGKGIVETVDNFGLQGKFPSHPALLDYLAQLFVEEGWSMKRTIKHILMSESFQRSSKNLEKNQIIDPDNNFLHHFPVQRLEAEAIRDGILAVSGRLDLTMYGISVPVHLTDFMTGRGRPTISGPLDGAGRRSIYITIRRNFLSPMMLVFDMPIPFSTFGRRNTTNVPAQSLTLMNDSFVHEQAKLWADNLLNKESLSTTERIQEIYLQAFSRQALPNELKRAEDILESLSKTYNQSFEVMKNDPKLWADYCHSIFNLKEFIHLL